MSHDSDTLTDLELAYYRRQLNLRELGPDGQARLKDAAVLVVGLGGLGSPLALYLAAAGVGRLGIVEFDAVETSNLHRQVLYGASQVGRDKLDCGIARLRDLNPHVTIKAHAGALTRENARQLVAAYDVVADGSDNFATRYLVNDACVLEDRPLVSASILGFEGQLSVYHHDGGPCFRCVFPEPPPPGLIPSCAEAGVLGVLPGVMGTLQATEVIKLIAGVGQVASRRLLHYDALEMTFSAFRVAKDTDCALCGDTPSIVDLVDYEEPCNGRPAEAAGIHELSPTAAAELLATREDPVLIDVREKHERLVDDLPRSRHIPLADLMENGVPFAPSQLLVLFCASGARSLLAAESLARRGYGQIHSLAGGLWAWRRQFPGKR